MLLTVMKHGAHRDLLGCIFKLKDFRFKNMIFSNAPLNAPALYENYVTDRLESTTTKSQDESDQKL